MWNAGNWSEGFCNGSALWGGGPGIFGWILPLLFWGLIIFGVISILKNIFVKNRDKQADNALDILKKRYAKGEINQQEFSEMKSHLSS
jgi:putative membrane protein